MTALAILTATVSLWTMPTEAQAITGTVTRYDPRLMEQVAVNRGIISHTAEYSAFLAANNYDGMVALERAGDRDRVVWIGGERFYVADCRDRDSFPGSHVAEVDYQTARRWLGRGPWPGEVVVRFERDERGGDGRYTPE